MNFIFIITVLSNYFSGNRHIFIIKIINTIISLTQKIIFYYIEKKNI